MLLPPYMFIIDILQLSKHAPLLEKDCPQNLIDRVGSYNQRELILAYVCFLHTILLKDFDCFIVVHHKTCISKKKNCCKGLKR
uniref:Uncharacterized protein n=1 Tax=Manihot esculenta TaxID=3983 RepID=A0A2C9VJE6_MANES